MFRFPFGIIKKYKSTQTAIQCSCAFELINFKIVDILPPDPTSKVRGKAVPGGLLYSSCMHCSHFTDDIICFGKYFLINAVLPYGCAL